MWNEALIRLKWMRGEKAEAEQLKLVKEGRVFWVDFNGQENLMENANAAERDRQEDTVSRPVYPQLT